MPFCLSVIPNGTASSPYLSVATQRPLYFHFWLITAVESVDQTASCITESVGYSYDYVDATSNVSDTTVWVILRAVDTLHRQFQRHAYNPFKTNSNRLSVGTDIPVSAILDKVHLTSRLPRAPLSSQFSVTSIQNPFFHHEPSTCHRS